MSTEIVDDMVAFFSVVASAARNVCQPDAGCSAGASVRRSVLSPAIAGALRSGKAAVALASAIPAVSTEQGAPEDRKARNWTHAALFWSSCSGSWRARTSSALWSCW